MANKLVNISANTTIDLSDALGALDAKYAYQLTSAETRGQQTKIDAIEKAIAAQVANLYKKVENFKTAAANGKAAALNLGDGKVYKLPAKKAGETKLVISYDSTATAAQVAESIVGRYDDVNTGYATNKNIAISATNNEVDVGDIIEVLAAQFAYKIYMATLREDTATLTKLKEALAKKVEAIYAKVDKFEKAVEAGKSAALNLGDGFVYKYTPVAGATVALVLEGMNGTQYASKAAMLAANAPAAVADAIVADVMEDDGEEPGGGGEEPGGGGEEPGGGEAREINIVSGGSTNETAAFNTTYKVPTTNATYTINGFQAGDKIDFDAAKAPTVVNADFADGIVLLRWANDGQVVDVTVTGLDTANEITLSGIAGWDTVFGAGTII